VDQSVLAKLPERVCELQSQMQIAQMATCLSHRGFFVPLEHVSELLLGLNGKYLLTIVLLAKSTHRKVLLKCRKTLFEH
jgi:hypothetical protein